MCLACWLCECGHDRDTARSFLSRVKQIQQSPRTGWRTPPLMPRRLKRARRSLWRCEPLAQRRDSGISRGRRFKIDGAHLVSIGSHRRNGEENSCADASDSHARSPKGIHSTILNEERLFAGRLTCLPTPRSKDRNQPPADGKDIFERAGEGDPAGKAQPGCLFLESGAALVIAQDGELRLCLGGCRELGETCSSVPD